MADQANILHTVFHHLLVRPKMTTTMEYAESLHKSVDLDDTGEGLL
jgi:hypothetical protein